VSSTDPVVVCNSLVKVYDSPAGRVQAVRGVDLEIEPATLTAVVGPSGSGKSSLLRMLAALDHPTAGYAAIAGIDLNAAKPGTRARLRRRLITHVYQRPADNLLAHLTSRQQLTRLRSKTGGVDADEALAALGIGSRRDHLPDQLSGGEKQRLALARALVAAHPVVIADEPTSTLDSQNASTVVDALAMLAERGVAVIVATHDTRVLPRMDEIVTLRDGAIASVTAGGTEAAIIDHSGRLQLPPHLRERFPDKRAILDWDEATETLQVRKP